MYGQVPGSSLGCISKWTYNLYLLQFYGQFVLVLSISLMSIYDAARVKVKNEGEGGGKLDGEGEKMETASKAD